LEVDKKIAALETRAKQDARKYKSEFERLSEVVKFKDNRIKELINEVNRLKIVIKAQIGMGKNIPLTPEISQSSSSNLEQKLSEFEKTGKIEYKIYLQGGETAKSQPNLEKIFNMNFPNLASSLFNQAKMLDECIQQVEIAKRENLKRSVASDSSLLPVLDEYKEKYSQMTKIYNEIQRQRDELEKSLNSAISRENILAGRFEQIIEIVNELIENSNNPNAYEISKKLDNLHKIWKNNKIENTKAWELPKEIQIENNNFDNENIDEIPLTFSEINKKIKEEIKNGNYKKAGEMWKKIDYNIPENLENENLLELIDSYQIICKTRDKQIENLENLAKKENFLQGTMELKDNEILELMTDYEDMKSKYIHATNIEKRELVEQISAKNLEINGYLAEIEKQKVLLSDKENEIKFLKTNIGALEKTINFEQKPKLLEKSQSFYEEKINDLENKLSSANKEILKINEKINENSNKKEQKSTKIYENMLENDEINLKEKIEKELNFYKENYFLYERQKEELNAAKNQILVLNSKLKRYEENNENLSNSLKKTRREKFEMQSTNLAENIEKIKNFDIIFPKIILLIENYLKISNFTGKSLSKTDFSQINDYISEIINYIQNNSKIIEQKDFDMQKLQNSINNLQKSDKDIENLKAEIDKLYLKSADLQSQNTELKTYNMYFYREISMKRRANEEIVNLINALKNEQNKQKDLSLELELMTNELKKFRINNNNCQSGY